MSQKDLKINKGFLLLLAGGATLILSVSFLKFSPKQISKLPPTEPKLEEKIEISGVKMANFLQDESENAGSSYKTLAKTKDYHIFFILQEKLFVVSITSYPFDNFRGIAEQELLKKLEISQEETCKLNVDITTPMVANPDKAGKIYKLSWCGEDF